MKLKQLVYLLVFLTIPFEFLAQSDSTQEANSLVLEESQQHEFHDPKKATLYALIPGGGQIYNKKYWKLPILYAGLGVSAYAISYNQKEYNRYKQEAINRFNLGLPADTVNFPDHSDQNVIDGLLFYENNRNISILVFVGVYLLGIIDATVDAYFFEYDVGEDVSLRASPYFGPPDFNSTIPINAGITLSLKL